MIISEIIGKKISKIRFNHRIDNNMQVFQSQIKFSDGQIILFPNDPNGDYDLTKSHDKNKYSKFEFAQRCGLASRVLFKNRKIKDIHFRFLDGEHFIDSNGILELENGRYITENSFGPLGLTDIGLIIMNQNQFEKLVDDEIEIRSLRKDIL